MSERGVLVFSQVELFREGLHKLLTNQPGITLLGAVATLAELKETASRTMPAVIIVNQEHQGELDGETLSALFDMTGEGILAFDLAGQNMIVYTRKQVPVSVQGLLDILTGGASDAEEVNG